MAERQQADLIWATHVAHSTKQRALARVVHHALEISAIVSKAFAEAPDPRTLEDAARIFDLHEREMTRVVYALRPALDAYLVEELAYARAMVNSAQLNTQPVP